jgi:predicted transcriptional regulator
MASRTVRVKKETHEILRNLAAKADTTIVAVLEEAVREYHRKKYWEEVDAGYARLRADPEAWAEYQEEIRAWDCTLMDGLEDWPYEGAT